MNREAFVGNLDQNSLLSTLDSFSGGGIGRLGVCSLGIVPFINAQIVFQLLTQIYPKLQDLQRREGEAGRKKVLQYTRYASVGFAVFQVRATGTLKLMDSVAISSWFSWLIFLYMNSFMSNLLHNQQMLVAIVEVEKFIIILVFSLYLICFQLNCRQWNNFLWFHCFFFLNRTCYQEKMSINKIIR